MTKTDLNHCRTVKEVLTGRRSIDEKALLSMEILKDRLDRIQRLDKRFSQIAFSPMAESLSARATMCTVG